MLVMLRRASIVRAAAPLVALLGALLAGCAGHGVEVVAPPTRAAVVPERNGALPLGSAIAELAVDMVGARYRYGGMTPADGFDCSGLAFYVYGEAGYPIPRTSQEQFRAARKIALEKASAGDLMFFQDQAKLSHVAIYLGDGRFVHAPASGQRVSVASLDSTYYQQHLVAVGRLLPPGL